MAQLLSIVALLISAPSALANSCCGQSPASYTVLSLNQTLSISTEVSYLQSRGRVFNNSKEFYTWEDKNREVQSFLFNVAGSFSERQQAFLNTNILQGHYDDGQEEGYSTKLSDTLLGYSYEVLPEYSFSYWKPIVFLTAFINLPTGHSIYDESTLSEGTDVSGHNQWGSGLGITLRKVYFPWTVTVQGRSIKLNSKKFKNVKVSDFYDSSLAFLLNYSSRIWGLQFNSGLTFNHLSERTIQPTNTSSGQSQNFTILIGAQKAVSERWTTGLNYSDQTLVGPAKNSILNRSISINFNYSYF